MTRTPPIGAADWVGSVSIKPGRRSALELDTGANLASTFLAAAVAVGAEEHNPREPVKSVGGGDANGALAVEEAAGHRHGRPTRADRGLVPVSRQCRRDAAPSFFLVVIDLVLQAKGYGVELVNVDWVGACGARRHVGDLPLGAGRAD